MPRVRRKVKDRISSWTDGERLHLRIGHDFLGRGFGGQRTPLNLDLAREAWNELRAEIMAQHIAENPGTRPWGWWVFDAPEMRRRTDGMPHPFENPERRAWYAKYPEAGRERDLWFGKPASMCVPDDFRAEWESETEYLRRLDMLTQDEAERLGLAP